MRPRSCYISPQPTTFSGAAIRVPFCWQSFLNDRPFFCPFGFLRAADPVARHAQWVSSPALETLFPRLHQNARDLLADLAAARGAVAAAASTTAVGPTDDAAPGTEGFAAVTDAEENREGPIGKTRSRSGSTAEGDEQSGRGAVLDKPERSHGTGAACGGREVGGAAPTGAAVQAGAWATGTDVEEMQLASLRKECKTLRIVVDALREKDEDSQVRRTTSRRGGVRLPLCSGSVVGCDWKKFWLASLFARLPGIFFCSWFSSCQDVRIRHALFHRSVLARDQ